RYVDRILNVPALNKYLFLGVALDGGWPVLVPRKRRNPNTWLCGAPGSGKTADYLMPLQTQEIAHGTGSEVIVDFKPDTVQIVNPMIEARRARKPFRILNITPGEWSHLFNPLAQSHQQRQNRSARIETLMTAMALEYGQGYGTGHYSNQNEEAAGVIFG